MLLVALSFVFIIQRIMDVDLDFAVLASPWVIAGLVALTLAYSCVVIITALNYRAWVYNVSGVLIAPATVLDVYCSANMYKYIPSGVFTVLGRNKLAVDNDELLHGKVAIATLLEGVFFVFAAVIVALCFSFDHAVTQLRQIEATPVIIAILAGIIITAAIVVYLKRKRLAKYLNITEKIGVLRPLVLVKRMGVALFLASTWGGAFLLSLSMMGQTITMYIAFVVIGLFCLSWLVGFFVPVAPAGLGVREAALLMFMGGVVGENYLLLALMAHRMVNVLADVIAYCFAMWYAKIKTGHKNERKTS